MSGFGDISGNGNCWIGIVGLQSSGKSGMEISLGVEFVYTLY